MSVEDLTLDMTYDTITRHVPWERHARRIREGFPEKAGLGAA